MSKKNKKVNGVLTEFKTFITRGNVLDMAVGVVIGGAFSAIVTAVVNILLCVCTWGVPGGLNGLITVLPALSAAQKGLDATVLVKEGEFLGQALGQSFVKDALQELAKALAIKNYGVETVTKNPALIESVKGTILSKYELYGNVYAYKLSAVINWGAVINAIISFLIIALTLFIIIKVAASMTKARENIKDKALEAYYKKHPEERPVEVVEEEKEPEPTEQELLKDILAVLKEKKIETEEVK